MAMPVHGAVTGQAQLRIAHEAQDARQTGLQHINKDHPNATTKDSQTHALALPRTGEHVSDVGRAGQVSSHTSTAGRPPEALSTGK